MNIPNDVWFDSLTSKGSEVWYLFWFCVISFSLSKIVYRSINWSKLKAQTILHDVIFVYSCDFETPPYLVWHDKAWLIQNLTTFVDNPNSSFTPNMIENKEIFQHTWKCRFWKVPHFKFNIYWEIAKTVNDMTSTLK